MRDQCDGREGVVAGETIGVRGRFCGSGYYGVVDEVVDEGMVR